MVNVSKFLSLVLRHDPARIGIVVDDAGWTDVAALLAAAAAHGVTITRDQLDQIVATSDKQRFALSSDGARIRANQGHSVPVELGLPVATPPARLYHGTVKAALRGIRARGLEKRARHHVHLSADLPTATKVGARRGAPVILAVRADDMAAAGHVFHRSENGVWLTDAVPAAFIDFPGGDAERADAAPARRGAGGGSRRDKIEIARATLAACDARFYTNARDERVELAGLIADAVAGTVLHELGDRLEAGGGEQRTAIEVTPESTIAALVRLAPRGGHLACLNFASAKNPGGGFLNGAQAQEESLARSSALYPCLQTQPEHYARNRMYASALYLDLAVWSPAVPVFRDDDGGWLDAPVPASIVTCAAPNAGALRQHGRLDREALEDTLRRRAAFVLAIAAHHRVDTLVLGAWGCGAFGNDPTFVADVFARLLETDYRGVFARVTFAVLWDQNHGPFAARFR